MVNVFTAEVVENLDCGQHIKPTEMQPDTDGGIDLSTVEKTESDAADPEDIAEAKELLQKINSWSEEEIERFLPTARKKVRQYRGVYPELDSV